MSAPARRLAAAWNRFWFLPVPASSIGLLRLVLGLLLVTDHLLLLPQLDLLFGADGPVPVAAAAGELPWPRWTWMDLVEDPLTLRLVWAAGLAVYVLFAAGFKGRLFALLALAVQVSLYQRDPFYQHGGDRVFRLATLYLCTVPCAASLSLDAWWRARKAGVQGLAARLLPPVTVPVIAHRLVQLQLAVIYVHSGYVKAQGRSWEDGTALYYAMSNGQYARAPWLVEPLLQSDLFVLFSRVATWVTLGWEAGFLLLIAWKPTRLLAIVIGLFVHGGIFFNLSVGSFSTVMLALYITLLDPQKLDRRLRRLLGAAPR